MQTAKHHDCSGFKVVGWKPWGDFFFTQAFLKLWSCVAQDGMLYKELCSSVDPAG